MKKPKIEQAIISIILSDSGAGSYVLRATKVKYPTENQTINKIAQPGRENNYATRRPPIKPERSDLFMR